MFKVTANWFWKVLFLLILCISFKLTADQTEVIHIDRAIIEKNLGRGSTPTLPFYPAGITAIKICNANEVETIVKSLHTERHFQGIVKLLVDGKPIEEKKVDLPPGRTVPVKFKLPFILESKHEIKILLSYNKPDDLLEWEKSLNFNEREVVNQIDIGVYNKIYFVPSLVKVDGNLSEWKDTKPLILNSKGDVFLAKDREKWKGPDDLSAKIYLGWDNEHIYIAAEVKDDKHCNLQPANTLWDGDAIQFAFAPLSIVTITPINLGVALSKGQSISKRWRGGVSGLFNRSKYIVKRDEEKKVTYYEIKIPCSSLNIEGRKGQMFGFNIVVFDDDDEKGQKYWMQLAPGLAPSLRAGQFKNFVLWK
jgi:hypothetical protein